MSIVSKLSSQTGDRSEESNRVVAFECMENPELLKEIGLGLSSSDAKIAGDCAEVMTMVAAEEPMFAVPYIQSLLKLINHKSSRARWEAVHAISLTVEYASEPVTEALPVIMKLIEEDKSIIVRDYATDILANYGKAGKREAEIVYPLLKKSLYVYEGRHAGHALEGLKYVVGFLPEVKNEVYGIALEFTMHKKAVIAKAAKSLMKIIEGKPLKTN